MVLGYERIETSLYSFQYVLKVSNRRTVQNDRKNVRRTYIIPVGIVWRLTISCTREVYDVSQRGISPAKDQNDVGRFVEVAFQLFGRGKSA